MNIKLQKGKLPSLMETSIGKRHPNEYNKHKRLQNVSSVAPVDSQAAQCTYNICPTAATSKKTLYSQLTRSWVIV